MTEKVMKFLQDMQKHVVFMNNDSGAGGHPESYLSYYVQEMNMIIADIQSMWISAIPLDVQLHRYIGIMQSRLRPVLNDSSTPELVARKDVLEQAIKKIIAILPASYKNKRPPKPKKKQIPISRRLVVHK